MNEKSDKEIIEVKEVEAERINRKETFRPRFKRIHLSPLFLISILIYVISGISGLFICFTVVKDVFGPIIALRKITLGLNEKKEGFPREGGYDIVAASEIMPVS